MTTYVVTTAADTNDVNDGQTSLREAINFANEHATPAQDDDASPSRPTSPARP